MTYLKKTMERKTIEKFKHFFSITLLVGLIPLTGCNEYPKKIETSLIHAGQNRIEFEKVLDYYKNEMPDPLKYEAACFLIKNMPYHTWQAGLSNYEFAFDSIARYKKEHLRRANFKAMLDSIKKIPSNDGLRTVYDIKSIDSNFLIENIELAFDAWYKWPETKRADFETFCNYVLPYRNDDEPIEQGTRRKLFQKYSWVFEPKYQKRTLKELADSIIIDFTKANDLAIARLYPKTQSISQYERSKIGTCQDGVNYFIHLFRAIGIPSSDESITHWGNHHSMGHSWFRLQLGEETYYENDNKAPYYLESIPKVKRRTFKTNHNSTLNNPIHLDVTHEYKETTDLTIDISLNQGYITNQAVLCVFDINSQWVPVVLGDKKFGKCNFTNLGTNVLYLPGCIYNGNVVPIGYPFYLSSEKQVHFYTPSTNQHNSIKVLRKAGLQSPRNRSKKKWIEDLNGGFFEASNNPSFDPATNLATINKLNSTQIQSIHLNNQQTFNYIRFNANGKFSFLSRLEFLNQNGEKLKGTVIKSNNYVFPWGDGAFDNNPLNFSGGDNFTLGLDLDKQQKISSIKFQARNDGNHIDINDVYELFYWDSKWKTLGSKTARDTLLTFDNVPENALLWLQNHSKGKEENVFTMDKNGKQHFLGFCKN